MTEIITVGGENYTATKVLTGIDTISFTLSDLTMEDAYVVFKNATSLEVGEAEGAAYGLYSGVIFDHLTIYADESVTVTMRIPTETEKQLRALQVSQAEQDEAIAELLYGEEVSDDE